MNNQKVDPDLPPRHARLLMTLEGLLAIEASEPDGALWQASQLVNATLGADKTDIFLYDADIDTLVAVGTSDTPMGRKEIALGLDRLPCSRGGRTVQTFRTGASFRSSYLDRDADELQGLTQELGVRSTIAVPLNVAGVRRGVTQVASAEPEQFPEEDVSFLEAVSHWVGMLLHRAELTQQVAEHAAEDSRYATAHELITILAHDLRAPLVPVRGYLSLMRMQAERDALPQYVSLVDKADTSVKRLESMLEDLLDASRLERGVFSFKVERLDLAALVRESADALRTAAANVEVQAPSRLEIRGDPNRLRQAVDNLLSNALRHSPDGVPVLLELDVEEADERAIAMITVRDAGPGIDPDLLSSLFSRFSSKGVKGGLGLGLYLAHGIALGHGGTLTVQSSPGQGASFRLALPIA